MALFNDTQVIQNNKDNSYGSCRLSYSSTCKSWFLLQEHDQSHTSHISFITSFWPYHIKRHMLQKQVRRPLIIVASFYVADIVSRPICDPIQKELEGPTKDRPAYWNAFARWISLHQHYIIDGDTYKRHTMPHEYNNIKHKSNIRLRMKHKQKLKRHPPC